MEGVDDKMAGLVGEKLCCGCTACASMCPQKAIEMVVNSEGFKNPVINQELCVECGLCKKVCPILNRKNDGFNHVKASYAVKHISEEVLRHSTSGGVFTALSDYVLTSGGVVYGAAFDDNMAVKHIRAESSQERDRIRGSKYVQSDMVGVFADVRSDLAAGRQVLFSGTPCQIDGLKYFLHNSTDYLICVDLVCNGVPSPSIFSEHLKLLEKDAHSKVTKYEFRPKRWTWRKHKEIVHFNNGMEAHSTPLTEIWKIVYYSRLATRPSCHNCKYTNLNRPSDITIADCRGIETVCHDFVCDAGASLVLVNTDKGETVFEAISKDLYSENINVNDFLQPPLKAPSKPSPLRDRFWSVYRARGYKYAVYACVGRLYHVKFMIKKLIGRS